MASSSPSASKELSCIDCSGSSDSDSSTQSLSDVESGPAPATKVVSLMDRLVSKTAAAERVFSLLNIIHLEAGRQTL